MKDLVILTDTRQQKENHINKVFDKEGVLHIRTTLQTADYMALRYSIEKGFYLDYEVLIDTKKDLLELAGNLCHTTEHERIKREVKRAVDLGAKEFIFLIGEDKIKTADDLKSWSSDKTKVKGETLYKVMETMKERYGIRFIICPKKEMGKRIIELLKK